MLFQRVYFVYSECRALFPSHKLKGNGYKVSAQPFLESFRWTSVTYDWLIVALNTGLLTLVHLNNPRNHCTESLYPFSLEFVKWGIANCIHFLLATTHQKHQFSFSSQRYLGVSDLQPRTKPFETNRENVYFFLSSWQKLKPLPNECQIPPSPYPKLFRIAWQLYTLVFRPRQL